MIRTWDEIEPKLKEWYDSYMQTTPPIDVPEELDELIVDFGMFLTGQ